MKQILGMILIMVSLVACELEPELDMRETSNHFSTLTEAGCWIRNNVQYYDSVPYNRQSPYQTEKTKRGHCADMVTLLLWYARDLGYDVEYMSVMLADGGNHALAVINGKVYDAETFSVFPRYMYVSVNYTKELDKVLEVIQDTYGNRNILGVDR